MAHLFRPSYTRVIPETATTYLVKGKPHVRWNGRNGKPKTAVVCPSGSGRCLCESESWHISYTDASGKPRTIKASKDRTAAEVRMGELVRQVEREKAGLSSVQAVEDAAALLSVRAEEYRDLLSARNNSARHVEDTYRQIVRVLEDCRWFVFRDIDRDRLERVIAGWRSAGMSVERGNHYLRSAKAFTAWLADRLGAADPLKRLSCLNPAADRRRIRRCLTDEEFARLVTVSRTHYIRQAALDGPARAALYLLAAYTGLRAGEMASLTPESFQLEGDNPGVTIGAADEKARRGAWLPLPADVARELRAWIDAKPANAPIFGGTWTARRGVVRLLRRDLAKAGIAYKTADGVCDLHSLRGVYLTRLARAGVPLATVQKLARHSSPTTTMKHYVRIGLCDLQGAVEKLPPIESCASLAGERAATSSNELKQAS